MTATPAELFAFLDRLAIPHRTVEHPAVFTVEESRHWHHVIPGAHTRNLFLKDKAGTLVHVVALSDTLVDLKTLHKRLCTGRFSFGSADLLRATLGVEPGSVTPFALINDTERKVRVVLDEKMMQEREVNYHPLVNTMSTTITPAGLMAFLKATGHEPTILPHGPDGL